MVNRREPEALALQKYPNMVNRAMSRMLAVGEAVDLYSEGKLVLGTVGSPTIFQIEQFRDGIDYCYSISEQWVHSIGKGKDGRIFVAFDNRFYQNPDFECLFLR